MLAVVFFSCLTHRIMRNKKDELDQLTTETNRAQEIMAACGVVFSPR